MNQTTNYFNPNKSRKRNIPLADKIELAKRVPQMYTQPRGQVLNSHRSILSPPYMDMDAYTLNLRFSCLGLNSTKEKRKESKVEKQLPVTNNTSNNTSVLELWDE
ncbi:hypothetical protein RF11_08095 [Thelohanellus kitauei]|uniref:Uncharacterized protein n=1 Tax=Thelohanellus kitauei TaxID=669202 RepID=A0A0C2MDN3_THEKT|nr:hypothetical protein RF11_08095 [Thelohanellus kitauei]